MLGDLLITERDVLDALPDVPSLATGRACQISRVRVPFVRHCYVLHVSDSDVIPTDDAVAEMLAIALRMARDLGAKTFNDDEAFTIIHNGHSVSRSNGPHIHIVCLRSRWHKGWFYFVLALKNWCHPVHRLFAGR